MIKVQHIPNQTTNRKMELEERSKSFKLEQQHKDHLTSLMMNNAKSSLATGVALSDSVSGVYNPKTGVMKTAGISSGGSNDDLGNSSRSQKSNDEASSQKAAQAPAKTMNTGRWSADEHKRFLAGLDQFG